MVLKILAVGDVVGECGLDALHHHLCHIKQKEQVDFTIVNGENAAGRGLLPRDADEIFEAGADVITLGNHTWGKLQIADYLDENPYILRPANFAKGLPGRGFGVYELKNGLRLGVLSLQGRLDMQGHLDNPFDKAEELLQKHEADLYVVDFHAEATSEKGALAWHLQGKVQAVWGTHTHVPTADTQILPKGTGFVSDLGMCGAVHSILGIEPKDSINLFRGGLPRRHRNARGKAKVNAVLFSIDTETKACIELRRVDVVET